jgi:hypothetical protein
MMEWLALKVFEAHEMERQMDEAKRKAGRH